MKLLRLARRARDPEPLRELNSICTAAVTYRDALEQIAPKQMEARGIIERNGFIFDDLGAVPGNWQHLAFTLYTLICEIDLTVSSALKEEE